MGKGTEEDPVRVRNFAPRFGIDEDAATGTSNGALTALLAIQGRVAAEKVFLLQGEDMGHPSLIIGQPPASDKEGPSVGGRFKLVKQGTLCI